MTLFNKYGLPEPVCLALSHDDYEPWGDYSTTALIKSPRMVQLQRRHQVTEDVTDRIFALIGNNTHHILEGIPKDDRFVVEQRYTTTILDRKVSGQIDLYEKGNRNLSDWKVTSIWAIREAKPEWEQQLNINAYLMEWGVPLNSEAPLHPPIEKLQIVAFLRDWSKKKAQTEKDYPKVQVAVIEYPNWSTDKQLRFLLERVQLHKDAEDTPDDELPECTAEERWEKPSKYAVMKGKNKRATRLLNTEKEAEKYIDQRKLKGCRIEFRQGLSERCENYCAVKMFCNQYKGGK